MNKEEQLQRLANQVATKNLLNDAISRQKDIIASEFCPVKVGDRVEVNGYSHRGKHMVVLGVAIKYIGRNTIRFVAHGNILKKDGFPGEQIGEWHSEMFSLPEAKL